MFSSEYYELFNNTYFEEHLLTAASDFLKQLQNTASVLTLLLSSDNLLTGYEQLRAICKPRHWKWNWNENWN